MPHRRRPELVPIGVSNLARSTPVWLGLRPPTPPMSGHQQADQRPSVQRVALARSLAIDEGRSLDRAVAQLAPEKAGLARTRDSRWTGLFLQDLCGLVIGAVHCVLGGAR